LRRYVFPWALATAVKRYVAAGRARVRPQPVGTVS
jgi:hypothetical protein